MTVAVDFPLCADAARDDAIRPTVERAVTFLVERLGASRLEGVILTGSLARGEGSVMLGAAPPRLLGDVEFLAIMKTPFDWAASRRRMLELSGAATRELGEGGRRAVIEYAPAALSYLRRAIRPSIFAHDLRCQGKVVWGRDDLLAEIKPFGVEAIPRDDAVELIMNRLIEVLALPGEAPADPEAAAYQHVKVVLDLAGSALAFAGRYASSYAARGQAFEALAGAASDLPAAVPALPRYRTALDEAIRFKLAPAPPPPLADARAAILAWGLGFWRWEVGRLLLRAGAPLEDLLAGYVGREPLRQRLRGWTKFYTHPLRPTGARLPLRQAPRILRASPRRLVYAAALSALAGRADGRAGWEARAAALLPLSAPAAGREAVVGRIVDLWRWLIRNN